ncbi:hypothetical protein PORY_002237 [Pneumocystis oryctolagi]|uniref:Uncharacterized protein n=1 Tax=Pneumocystis oryctolagi TaxID=42067 RepID=A0ACB7C986_9ASCO|nr:hypothetical protein PORY_002237 [Pneumocystis oryctolagi]
MMLFYATAICALLAASLSSAIPCPAYQQGINVRNMEKDFSSEEQESKDEDGEKNAPMTSIKSEEESISEEENDDITDTINTVTNGDAEQGFVALEESTEIFSGSNSDTLSEAPSELSSDIISESLAELSEPLLEFEKEHVDSNSDSKEETLFSDKEKFPEKSIISDSSEKLLFEEVIQDPVLETTNNIFHSLTYTDQNELYEKDQQFLGNDCQGKSEEYSSENFNPNITLFSGTMQETTQQNSQLVSDMLNPIPSSLDLQKLLATLSSAPQLDPQSTIPLTTSNNPLSPNFIEALNTVSSTNDANAIQPALTHQPKHKNTVDHDIPCTPQEDTLFQKFLVDEKRIMSNIAPHEFPPGSRMFIGNLPTEKVTKKDVFRVFYSYGRLGQIALKQAYGFVQFFSPEECQNAINGEQGTVIRGRKIHLEVSKPQKHKPASNDKKNYRSRSRSPDIRDRSPVRGRNRSRGRGSHGYNALYDRDNKKDRYILKEDYGRRRSSPLLSRSSRDHDIDYHGDYKSTSSDLYNDHFQRQQMDSFPLPRRYGNDVPECQIIITDDTDRSFIYFVEKNFRDKGFRVDTLFLSPKLSLPSVVQQMIIEGIMAIIFLNRQMQSQSKISMQIFDRKEDSSDVKFDEYANIDVHVAVVLALRKKQSTLKNTYGTSNSNNTNFQLQNPTLNASNAALASLIGSLDSTTLQKVIGALTQPSQQLTSQMQSMPYTPLQTPHQGASAGKNYSVGQEVSSMTKPQQQPDLQVQNILGQLAKLQNQHK